MPVLSQFQSPAHSRTDWSHGAFAVQPTRARPRETPVPPRAIQQVSGSSCSMMIRTRWISDFWMRRKNSRVMLRPSARRSFSRYMRQRKNRPRIRRTPRSSNRARRRAIRRDAYLAAAVPGLQHVHGYDPRFGFYAEEYDLAARLMLAGGRISLDRRFAVLHEKTPAGRSSGHHPPASGPQQRLGDRRYAPGCRLRPPRCASRTIAPNTPASPGRNEHRSDTRRVLSRHWQRSQPSRARDGCDHLGSIPPASVPRAILQAWGDRRFASAMIAAPGKNEHVVRETLAEMGVSIVDRDDRGEAIVIGTLSPGPAAGCPRASQG